jgi:hypothetical protein
MSTTLHDLIAYVETKNDSAAFRFEPATYSRLIAKRSDSQKAIIAKIIAENNCSWGTAIMIFCSSFGLTQIMGENLYAGLFDGKVIDYLNDPSDQRNAFARFLNANRLAHFSPEVLSDSHAARIEFALKYNGSPDYARAIESALVHFSYTIGV